MLDHGVIDIFINHGVDEPVIILDVLSLLAFDDPAKSNRGDSEVGVEDVNDRNNNDNEVEVDPTYSIHIEYLIVSEDEEIVGARSKFQKRRKKREK